LDRPLKTSAAVCSEIRACYWHWLNQHLVNIATSHYQYLPQSCWKTSIELQDLFSPYWGSDGFIAILGLHYLRHQNSSFSFILLFCFYLSVEPNSQWAKIRVLHASLGGETEWNAFQNCIKIWFLYLVYLGYQD